MPIRKLESTAAFLADDLDGVPVAAGQVRLAPKILQDGAKLLARSWTYAFASFERQVGGLSAGISAKPDERDAAVSAFAGELAADVREGKVLLEPAKGVTDDDLGPLREVDPRGGLYWEHRDDLRGEGAVICADAVAGGLAGKDVAIEGFDAAGPEIARGVYDRGGRVVAVSTAQGAVVKPSGLEAPLLGQAWREQGPELVAHLDAAAGVPEDLFAAGVDVLFAGSRAGVVDHEIAAGLEVAAVVPAGPVPVTAKALAALRRAGTIVLPDFITTAAPVFAMWPDADATVETVRAAAAVGLQVALADVVDHDEGPLLGACYRAESYLATWRDELPFGRPLA